MIRRDGRSGEPVQEFVGHDGAVEAAAFSRDGMIVATGGADQTVRLHDVATGEEFLRLELGVHVRDLAFSPDGSALAVIGGLPGAHALEVWALYADDLVAIARERVGRALTEPECELYRIDPCG